MLLASQIGFKGFSAKNVDTKEMATKFFSFCVNCKKKSWKLFSRLKFYLLIS
jgi:hypothetical protein